MFKKFQSPFSFIYIGIIFITLFVSIFFTPFIENEIFIELPHLSLDLSEDYVWPTPRLY